MIAPRENTGEVKKSAAKRAGLARLVVWGIVVAGAAWLVLPWIMGDGDIIAIPVARKKKSGKIQEVAHSKATADAMEPSLPKPELTDYELRHVPLDMTNELSAAEYEYWKMFNPIIPVTESPYEKTVAPYHIFKRKSDNEIAFVLSLEPGKQVFGNLQFGEKFTQRFLRSLDDPVVIYDDDSDYDKELKAAVIEARKELKERYDAGEDIGAIMDDARSELQRLGRYKQDLQKEVEKIARNKDLSDDDLADLLRAANAMLAEKGVAPIELNPMSRLALRVQNSIQWNNSENGGEGYDQ